MILFSSTLYAGNWNKGADKNRTAVEKCYEGLLKACNEKPTMLNLSNAIKFTHTPTNTSVFYNKQEQILAFDFNTFEFDALEDFIEGIFNNSVKKTNSKKVKYSTRLKAHRVGCMEDINEYIWNFAEASVFDTTGDGKSNYVEIYGAKFENTPTTGIFIDFIVEGASGDLAVCNAFSRQGINRKSMEEFKRAVSTPSPSPSKPSIIKNSNSDQYYDYYKCVNEKKVKLCSVSDLCSEAIENEYDTNGTKTKKWSTKNWAKNYVKEAKKRGVTCGVGDASQIQSGSSETASVKTDDIKQLSSPSICENATATRYNSKAWVSKDGQLGIYVNEAKRRGLTCGVISSNDTNIASNDDERICANAVSQLAGSAPEWFTDKQSQIWVIEAKRRGLSCGVSEASSQSTTQSSTFSTTSTPSKADTSKAFCKDIGFTAGTEKFGECVLKMMDK